MHFEAHLLYHVYNRGNNGLKLFYKPDHYYFFLGKMRLHLLPHCQLVAHCLMPNHFHFLLQPTLTGAMQNDSASSVRQPLVRGLATLLSSYTQALNPRLQRRGALFQPKTKSKLLAAAPYPLTCFHYNSSKSGARRPRRRVGRLALFFLPGLRGATQWYSLRPAISGQLAGFARQPFSIHD